MLIDVSVVSVVESEIRFEKDASRELSLALRQKLSQRSEIA